MLTPYRGGPIVGSSQSGSYLANSGLAAADYASGGLVGDLYKAFQNMEPETIDMIGAAQDAMLYPGKVLAQATIGNTQAGKDWIQAVEDNLTINGVRARNGVEQMQGDANKRQKLESDGTSQLAIGQTPVQVPESISREVKTNKTMKQRIGSIFRMPKGLGKLTAKAVGLVPIASSVGHRLKQIHDAYAMLHSK